MCLFLRYVTKKEVFYNKKAALLCTAALNMDNEDNCLSRPGSRHHRQSLRLELSRTLVTSP